MYFIYTRYNMMLLVKIKYLENILIVLIIKKNYYKYRVIKLKCCKLTFLNGRFTTISFFNSQVECIY